MNQNTSTLSKLLPLYIVIFIGFVGYSLMITIFTPLILHGNTSIVPPQSSTSYRTILLGILLFIYPCGQFFGSPILGALSDRFGRKPILMTSLCITTICYALIAVALSAQNLFLLIVILLIAGFSEGNIVIAQSAIADTTPENQRAKFFGYIYLSASSAYVIGPLIGGKLAEPTPTHWFFSYATPFWFVVGLLIITTLWTLKSLAESRPPELRQYVSYFAAFSNLLNVFTNQRLRIFYLINFLLYLAIFGFFRCYPMYLVDEFHLGVGKISEFIAWVGVPIVLANLWLTGFLSQRYNVKHLTIFSALLTGIFMILVVIPASQASLWITLFLTSLALAICLPASATLLSTTAHADEQGRVMGNNQALQVGAEALSGLVGGLLAAILVKLSLIILGIVAIIAAGIIVVKTK